MQHLNNVLLSLLGSQQLVEQWWKSNNKAFDGKTPEEVFLSSKEGHDLVLQYVHRFTSGDYS